MLRSPINCCFILTAPGTSALATVRVAGPGVATFLERRFSKHAVPDRAIHGEIRDDAGVIDDPVVVLRTDGFAADLTLHGGAWVTRCVIALAERDGFEVSPIDVQTIGSTDATTIFEHEMIVSLPQARTERSVRTLLAQRSAWAALAKSPLDGDAIDRVLTDRSLEHLLSPPTVAIVGLPNAGKSTLANALFGQQRSIVSPLAGTTRDWIGEEANLDGLIVKLMDTPGRRMTDDAIETAAIKASDAPIEAADAILLLLDASRDDAEQAALLTQHPRAIVALNKSDKRLAAWTDGRLRAVDATLVCAMTGAGLDAIVSKLHAHFGANAEHSRPRIWTQRQRAAVREGRLSDVLA